MFYAHDHPYEENKELEENKKKEQDNLPANVTLPKNYIKEMLFSKYYPIPYDQKHIKCERKMVYFTSRVAIVAAYEGEYLKQNFYEGHSAKISCMDIHPSSKIFF